MSQTQNYPPAAQQQGGFFDGTNDDESCLNNFDPLPEGDYLMMVKNCEVKASKKNPNTLMYAIEFDVCQGPHQGRKHFENFCFQHTNVTAVNIGRARMKQLCLSVVGRPTIGQPYELYAKPLTVRLKVKFDKERGPQSVLVTMGPATGIAPTPAQSAAPQQAPAAPNPQNQPPRPDGSIPQRGDTDFVPF